MFIYLIMIAVPDPNAPKKEISKMISTDKYGQPISRQLPTQQPTSASKTSQPPPTSAQTLTTGSDGASDSTLSLPSRPRSTVSSHYNGPYPHQAVERISVASQTTPSYQQVGQSHCVPTLFRSLLGIISSL